MGNFIQKFRYKREYDEAEHQYPNISLIYGEDEEKGLIWTAEEPARATILFNGSEIKWTVDVNQYDTMKSGTLGIDLNAAVAFNRAVDDGTVSISNAWFELDGTRYDADAALVGGGDSLRFNVILNAITNTKSAAPQFKKPTTPQVNYTFEIIDGRDTVEGLIIEENSAQTAHWGLNYTIDNGGRFESFSRNK